MFPKGAIRNRSALVQVITRHRKGTKPLLEPMLIDLQVYSKEYTLVEFGKKNKKKQYWKILHLKISSAISC